MPWMPAPRRWRATWRSASTSRATPPRTSTRRPRSASVLLAWVGLNAVLLSRRGSTFDPYPFILLNLFLSMLAAIQAPVIPMSVGAD